MNETLRLLEERKSVRAFTERPITEEEVGIILNAAVQAPSAGNQQLYTILRVTDPERKKRLSESCDHQPFIAEAKLVLVFLADCLKWYRAFEATGCNPRRPGPGDLMLAVVDAVIAAQNAVVAASSLGIGSCYIGDIMENIEEQREILELPEYVFPAAMLVFGYPTDLQLKREKPVRSPMHLIVSENTYPAREADQLREMLEPKAGRVPYGQWMEAFCKRKYHSDFCLEISRSVETALEAFRDWRMDDGRA